MEEEIFNYLWAVVKRKLDKEDDKPEVNKGKKIHRSLKDDPKPIAIPALRKKRENELKDSPKQKSYQNQIHPSIMTQPLINKEKDKEKEIRDKERASTSEPPVEIIEVEEIEPNIHTQNENKETTANQTLKKLVKGSTNNNSMVSKSPRVQKIIQMIADQKSYDVIEDLNNIKCNITLAQLLDVSPKVKAKVMQSLKFEKDNVCDTTILVNNIDHTYKSRNIEPSEDDIAMVDVTVNGVKGKALMDSCSNLSIVT